MEENYYDCNNSMDEEKEKEKAIEEANNTMIEKNKENQIINKKKKEKRLKKENKINKLVNEINNDLEEYNILAIENIFEINNKFDYPKQSPLFYLKDELNNNSNNLNNDIYKEPLSSNKLKELLKSKKIKPYLINVKLIDIFSMKNHSPFSFFPLNEILEKNWSKNLEYSPLFMNIHNKLNEKEKDKEKEKEKEKEIVKKQEKKQKKKDEDLTLNLNFSGINASGFNDLSMSIIKQLEGINLTKKQVDKITSIIEKVEEEEWQEKKKKKKESVDDNNFDGIVGLNENKTNKKNKKFTKKKNRNYINDNNQFKGLKIDFE